MCTSRQVPSSLRRLSVGVYSGAVMDPRGRCGHCRMYRDYDGNCPQGADGDRVGLRCWVSFGGQGPAGGGGDNARLPLNAWHRLLCRGLGCKVRTFFDTCSFDIVFYNKKDGLGGGGYVAALIPSALDVPQVPSFFNGV